MEGEVPFRLDPPIAGGQWRVAQPYADETRGNSGTNGRSLQSQTNTISAWLLLRSHRLQISNDSFGRVTHLCESQVHRGWLLTVPRETKLGVPHFSCFSRSAPPDSRHQCGLQFFTPFSAIVPISSFAIFITT